MFQINLLPTSSEWLGLIELYS